jgi:predicted TIM-barrel fold metal-dependent hydrolase
MSYHAAFHAKAVGHAEETPLLPIVDAHLHYVDFIQDSDGLKRLLQAMDAGNVAKAVLFGLPVKKKWESYETRPPHYYLDDNARCYYYHRTDEILASALEGLATAEQERFAPLICGFNPTDRYAVRDVERMLEAYPFWRGVGEILCRHDDLTNLTNEEVARANHPALFDIYALCGERKLPVLLHQNSTSVSHHEDYEHLHEVEEILERFPGTTFVWAHCGISRRVSHKQYHRMVETLIAKHPNLNGDISWVVYDDVVCTGGEPKKHWLDFLVRHSDRFFIGSDLCGHFDHLGKTLARYNELFRLLGPEDARRIASENADRMWFGRR